MTQHNFAPEAINTRTAWRPVLRPIGRILIAAQLALVLQPLSALAQDQGAQPYNPVAQAQLQRYAQMSQAIEVAKASQGKSAADAVSDKFGQAQELVASLKAAGTPDKPAKHGQLKELLAQINAGAADVRAEFAATRAELQKKGLPQEILARHDEAVAQFEQRAASFGQIVALANDEERVAKLAEFFDKHPAKRKPGKSDPKKLPWSTPEPNKRAPAETQTAWFQHLWGAQKVQLAQAGGSIGPLNFTTMPEAGQAPTPADLAETDEVQITAQIRAKAAELGNNPVAIYNWVRNTIEWAPTAGAIQSAQDTLDKKRGNATDTASLLIALLRAANIPARYQWGTIDVPADKAMNWVGGVTKAEAAQQLLGQGGIANRGMSSGGRITAIRMEHVWVQAYVNWSPSRGSKNASDAQHPNPNAPLNAWVPLDASFKQYNYAAGMDLKTAVPLDANALLNAAKQGATVNEAQGWVQNLNQAAIQSQLTDYQSRLKAYIDSTATGPNSTVGDVIGKKIIPQNVQSLLAGTLQNAIVLQGTQAASVPASWQHKFTYRLYASQYDQYDESPMLSYTEKTSKLVGKRLTLTYLPASQADADLIASYLPKPHADGSPIQPNEMPQSLPGYLIRVKPTISLDGQVVAQSSSAVQMGTDLYSTGGFTQLYDRGQWDLTSEESNVAGNATAIGINAGGISAVQLDTVRTRLLEAQAAIKAASFANPSPIANLTGERVIGDMLAATIWTWFALADNNSKVTQGQAGIVENPGLSHGLFHVIANPILSWGVIRKVTFPAVNLDVGHVRNLTWSKEGDAKRWVDYNYFRGQQMSALEHAVPERMFNSPAHCNLEGADANPALSGCPRGISAVRALGLAQQLGQKVYKITQAVYASNPGIVQSDLAAHSESTKARVQQALDAGHEVVIHERPITESGWTGAGFTIIDPQTGAGAYLIEGGSNGSWQQLLVDLLKAILGGALLAIAVLAIPFQILCLAYGATLFAAIATVVGILAAVGAVLMGVSPVVVASLRAALATLLVFGVLAFGPATVVAPIALVLFGIWLLAAFAVEFAILMALAG